MKECLKFYINGEWVEPVTPKTLDVINPATEEPIGRISLGSAADVDKAVQAARIAFETFGRTTREERIALLERIIEAYYSYGFSPATRVTFDYQFIANPGYNTDRGPVSVFGARVHSQF